MIEEKCDLFLTSKICPFFGISRVRIKPTEMSGNGSMKTTNETKQYLFFSADVGTIFWRKTILLINQVPYICAIVVGIRFNIFMNVEILSCIVLFILNMPNPVTI
jgi:hypothetical protein